MRHILTDQGGRGNSERRPSMARAGVASASAHSDSIKGLAQSIAKPAYRRLLTAEPLLRRAVPVLIIAFLATICVGAVVQTARPSPANAERHGDRRSTPSPISPPSGCSSRCKSRRRGRTAAASCWRTRCRPGRRRRPALPPHQSDGVVAAATPGTTATVGRRLIDLLGPTQPLTTFGAGAGVMEITLPDQRGRLPPCAC